MLQPGDVFEYQMKGEVFDKSGKSLGAVECKGRLEHYTARLGDRQVLAKSQTYYDVPSYMKDNPLFSSNKEAYCIQDAETRDLTLAGFFVGSREITLDPLQLGLPGAWREGLRIEYRSQDRFNFAIDQVATITGKEIVTVPLGTFEAWKVNNRSSHSVLGEWENTDWFAPRLGATVRSAGSLKVPSREQFYMIADLQLISTNVPLDYED